jgi:hypothetical protein
VRERLTRVFAKGRWLPGLDRAQTRGVRLSGFGVRWQPGGSSRRKTQAASLCHGDGRGLAILAVRPRNGEAG